MHLACRELHKGIVSPYPQSIPQVWASGGGVDCSTSWSLIRMRDCIGADDRSRRPRLNLSTTPRAIRLHSPRTRFPIIVQNPHYEVSPPGGVEYAVKNSRYGIRENWLL